MINKVDTRESVRQLIDRQALEQPGDVFLVQPESGLRITFQELQAQTKAVAAKIATSGVSAGSSVAFAMSNGHTCAVTVLGIMYGGYRAVAINLVAGRDVIAYVLAHSQTTLVLTQAEHKTLLSDALACDAYAEHNAHYNPSNQSIPTLMTVAETDIALWASGDACEGLGKSTGNGADNSEGEGANNGKSESAPHANARSITDLATTSVHHSSDALLMYTSGTTGLPKGVTLSQSSVIAGGRNVVQGHQITQLDRALCVLPLYHINGLCVTLFGPLVSASSLVLPYKFSTSAFWGLIDEHRCSWFSVVPTQIAYLLRDGDATEQADNERQSQSKRQHLRFGRSASAPLSPDVHLAFEQRFGVPLIETMGLTESAAQILSNPMPPAERKHGSPGVAVGCEVTIVNKSLQPVNCGEEGELMVRGDNIMNRYFRNDEVTSQTLLNDGWLRTGDLGRKDADGYVFITGRLKELIIKGGENIAPREIDDALYQYSDVVEAAAFACPCKDFGQRVEAAVVLKASSTLNESELLEGCEQRVGRFKRPDKIHFMRELPKGPSGKIQRAKIHQLLVG